MHVIYVFCQEDENLIVKSIGTSPVQRIIWICRRWIGSLKPHSLCLRFQTTWPVPLKPFTDSSLGWNVLPPSSRGARSCRLTRGHFYGSQPVLIGWWIQKVKGGKVTPLALAVTASQLLLSMSRQTTLQKNGPPPAPPPALPLLFPSLRLLALGFTADRHDICSKWNL